MPVQSLAQTSFFDPQFACPDCLEPGKLPWVLATHRNEIFPGWLFVGWRGSLVLGRSAYPPALLATLMLLRWTEEGMSRRASTRRATTDAQWRAAMGIALNDPVPSERTLRDFEWFMSTRHRSSDVPRYMLLHAHIVRLCLVHGVVKDEAKWMCDSSPMWCYGATLDTIRLLGEGLRALGRTFGRATRQSLAQVAKLWELPLLLAKSTKGAFSVNWRDPDARSQVVSELANNVLRIVRHIANEGVSVRNSFKRGLDNLCKRLLRVVRDDLEEDESGRLVIAKRVTSDRLISLTEPMARNGRKSKSHTFKGFKSHVLGDLVSGVLAAVTVTKGNDHDRRPATRLVRRAKRLIHQIDEVLGDSAYGGMELRRSVADKTGVRLVSPPVGNRQPRGGRFQKADFAIDFKATEATCPAGVTTSEHRSIKKNGDVCTRFAWAAETCKQCPLRKRCCSNTSRKMLTLHPQEEELRQTRADWEEPEMKSKYRYRCQGERLVNQLTRHGARKARSWGLRSAHRQVHAIAMMCNLQVLARRLKPPDT